MLPAGVGGRVAAVVPALDAALRPRRAQRSLSPAPDVPEWIGRLRARAHPAHGREPFDRGRGRRRARCSGRPRALPSCRNVAARRLERHQVYQPRGKSRSPNSKPSARAAAVTSSLVEGRVPRPGVTDSSPKRADPSTLPGQSPGGGTRRNARCCDAAGAAVGLRCGASCRTPAEWIQTWSARTCRLRRGQSIHAGLRLFCARTIRSAICIRDLDPEQTATAGFGSLAPEHHLTPYRERSRGDRDGPYLQGIRVAAIRPPE